jgi:hypothetical protein
VSLEETNLDVVLLSETVVILSRRDDPDRARIELLPSQWEALRDAIKAGELDRLPRKGHDIGWSDGPDADALRRGI